MDELKVLLLSIKKCSFKNKNVLITKFCTTSKKLIKSNEQKQELLKLLLFEFTVNLLKNEDKLSRLSEILDFAKIFSNLFFFLHSELPKNEIFPSSVFSEINEIFIEFGKSFNPNSPVYTLIITILGEMYNLFSNIIEKNELLLENTLYYFTCFFNIYSRLLRQKKLLSHCFMNYEKLYSLNKVLIVKDLKINEENNFQHLVESILFLFTKTPINEVSSFFEFLLSVISKSKDVKINILFSKVLLKITLKIDKFSKKFPNILREKKPKKLINLLKIISILTNLATKFLLCPKIISNIRSNVLEIDNLRKLFEMVHYNNIFCIISNFRSKSVKGSGEMFMKILNDSEMIVEILFKNLSEKMKVVVVDKIKNELFSCGKYSENICNVGKILICSKVLSLGIIIQFEQKKLLFNVMLNLIENVNLILTTTPLSENPSSTVFLFIVERIFKFCRETIHEFIGNQLLFTFFTFLETTSIRLIFDIDLNVLSNNFGLMLFCFLFSIRNSNYRSYLIKFICRLIKTISNDFFSSESCLKISKFYEFRFVQLQKLILRLKLVCEGLNFTSSFFSQLKFILIDKSNDYLERCKIISTIPSSCFVCLFNLPKNDFLVDTSLVCLSNIKIIVNKYENEKELFLCLLNLSRSIIFCVPLQSVVFSENLLRSFFLSVFLIFNLKFENEFNLYRRRILITGIEIITKIHEIEKELKVNLCEIGNIDKLLKYYEEYVEKDQSMKLPILKFLIKSVNFWWYKQKKDVVHNLFIKILDNNLEKPIYEMFITVFIEEISNSALQNNGMIVSKVHNNLSSKIKNKLISFLKARKDDGEKPTNHFENIDFVIEQGNVLKKRKRNDSGHLIDLLREKKRVKDNIMKNIDQNIKFEEELVKKSNYMEIKNFIKVATSLLQNRDFKQPSEDEIKDLKVDLKVFENILDGLLKNN